MATSEQSELKLDAIAGAKPAKQHLRQARQYCRR